MLNHKWLNYLGNWAIAKWYGIWLACKEYQFNAWRLQLKSRWDLGMRLKTANSTIMWDGPKDLAQYKVAVDIQEKHTVSLRHFSTFRMLNEACFYDQFWNQGWKNACWSNKDIIFKARFQQLYLHTAVTASITPTTININQICNLAD